MSEWPMNKLPKFVGFQAEYKKLCLETAGTSLQNVMKCNIYCTSATHFPVVNAIYARYFPEDPPARIFVCRNGPGRSISKSIASP
jgi:hypothetical protein